MPKDKSDKGNGPPIIGKPVDGVPIVGDFESVDSSKSLDLIDIVDHLIIPKNLAAQLTNNEGYIVTNSHVLVDATHAQIITYEQETANAELIGYRRDLDLALLKISGNYDSIKLGDSDDVQIGEKVIAIGNPLRLQFSVTEGIISAVHREGLNELEAYLQTDAALNPGNSGGPLINKKGKVVGINNFKVGGGESLGFALESNYIKDTINEIAEEILKETLI